MSFKDATDIIKSFRALLTGVSKAFDCLCDDLIIAKLLAYDLVVSSLNLLQDYLSNIKQRTKVDSFFSSWEDVFSEVSQGSTLDPSLFNIFMCDMVLILKTTYFSSYADDNIPFGVTDNIQDVIRSLEEVGENLITQFCERQTKLNPDKCHQLQNTN